MTARRRPLAGLVAALGVLAGACAGGPPETLATEDLPPPFTYVAVGASETLGAGATDPVLEAWPSVFLRTALARSATLVDVGVAGSTVRQAVDRQLGAAVAEAPRLATVWLNVNDIVRQVPVADYERDLTTLVRGLRRGGATEVLVAAAPPVADLPAVRACLPGGTGCRLSQRLPSAEAVTARVADYDAAVGRVAAAEGAVVVDLAAAAGGALDAGWVAADGLHPSTAGHRRVAEAFAAAFARLPAAAELGPPAPAPG